jgi:SAM-dependent methyltransferase
MELARLRPYVEAVRGFSGWDLSKIAVRALEPGPPWEYEALAREEVLGAGRVLDLGTGGGEVLGRIAAGSGVAFVATEQWGVNARVAYGRLRAAGIPLVWCETGEARLPFADASFDTVLSRHTALDPLEVDRVLRPGGQVLTQQVTPDTWPELRPFFPRMTVFPDHYGDYPAAWVRLGYEVTRERHEWRSAFATLGDLVQMLLVAPWYVPGLDIESDLEALLALERELGTHKGIVVTEGRYLVRARKPGLAQNSMRWRRAWLRGRRSSGIRGRCASLPCG